MASPGPLLLMRENMREVNRLLEIHWELTGGQPGRRHGVEVLNKSAIVLITACWESLVEDFKERTGGHPIARRTAPAGHEEMNQMPARHVQTARTS